MQPDPIKILKTHALFSFLLDEQLIDIIKKISKINIKSGYTLFIQDDPAQDAYCIVSGGVKLFRHTADGEEYVIDVLTKGHLLGEGALFHEGSYPYGAEAIEDTALLCIPLIVLKQLLDDTQGFARHMLSFTVRQNIGLEKHREHLVIQSAPQRLGCFLLQLLPKDASGPITLDLPYDKLLLAARLGMRRETLSRALNQLHKGSGIIMKGASVFIPDTKALAHYCCNACTHHYPCGE